MLRLPIRRTRAAWFVWVWALPLFVPVGRTLAQRPADGEGSRIEGYVLESGTGRPLEGANVVVLGTTSGAASQPDGSYFVPGLSPGTYRVQFSFIGFETLVRTDVVVNAGAPTVVDARLVPSAVRLQELTIRPELFVEELAAPPSATTLRREEIRRFPGALEDVVATVTALPGVAQVAGGGRNDLVVRGGGPAENLFLVNGLEVPNINHFSTQGTSGGALSFVNLDFVDRVEFSAGGFGAAYGDRLSSVFALETRSGRTDRIGGRATVSATQYGLDLEGPLGPRTTFLGSLRRSYLDLIFKAAGVPFVPVYTDANFFAESRLSPRDRVSFLGLLALDEVETDRGSSAKRRTVASILDNTQTQLALGSRYRHLIADGFLEVVAGYTRTDFMLSQADTAAVATEYFSSDAVEDKISLKGEFLRRFDLVGDVSGGLGADWAGIDDTVAFADTVFNQSGERVTRTSLGLPARVDVTRRDPRIGVWAQVKRKLSTSWELTAGLRFDRYQALTAPDHLAPRLALAHRPTDRFKLSLAYGRYYQTPSAVWLANPVNRDLKALRSDMGVVGGEILVRDDTSVRVETYYKAYHDLPGGIDAGTDSTAATDYLVLSNSGIGFGGREDDFRSFGYVDLASRGRGESFGAELLVKKKFSEVPCYGQLSVAVSKTGYRAANQKWYPGQFDQRMILGLSGGYVINPRWELSARFRLISGAPYTPAYDPRSNTANPGQVRNLPDEYLSRRLPWTHQLDMRVDRRWNFSGWALITFLDVQDVYNQRVPQPPTWNFEDERIENRNAIGILPALGVSAIF